MDDVTASPEAPKGGATPPLVLKSTGGPKVAHPHACLTPGSWEGHPVRCRKCRGCRKHREWQWMRRVATEYACHPSTWFITLTLREQATAQTYEAVRLCLRDVRREFGYAKYVTTEERGSENDRLHWHVLLHLPCGDTRDSVRDAVRWPWGFRDVSRVASARRAGRYVGKYLAKGGKLRASFAYGEGREVYTPALIAAFEAFPSARFTGIRQGMARTRTWESKHVRTRANVGRDMNDAPIKIGVRSEAEAEILRSIRFGTYVLDPS